MPTGRANARLMTGSAKQSRIRKKARMDCFASLAMTCNPDTVIPGWSAGPDPESRDSGFDASHRPGMTESGSLPLRNDVETQVHIRLRDLAARCARALQELFRPMEGVGNAGCPLHPRSRVHFVLVERTRVTTSTPESPGIPARNGFNGLCRALVSSKSARMCERAAPTSRPSLELSPIVLEGLEPAGERGTDPVSSSTRTVAWA